MGRRQPAADEPLHSFPLKATVLAPSSEDVVPEVAHGETKVSQSVPVARYSEVSDMRLDGRRTSSNLHRGGRAGREESERSRRFRHSPRPWTRP